MLREQTVALVAERENGLHPYCSGVWVSATTILTAAHCMSDDEIGEEVEYVTDGDVFEAPGVTRKKISTRHAEVYALDAYHDLVLLRTFDGPFNHAFAHLSQAPIAQGASTQCMGTPMGLWFSYSTGMVAAVRSIDEGIGFGKLLLVQTTAPISPGNSGGGLFNDQGLLIGIAHTQMTRGQALNFFVHRDLIKDLLGKQGEAL